MGFKSLFKAESSPAILLIIFALLAMLLKNSPLAEAYNNFLLLDLEVRAESFSIEKPLLLWINDGLMAIFFFLIGLELKKEVLTGQLSIPGNVILPIAGAIGGVLAPAGIYLALNYQNTLTAHGWAIPIATDIAFSLGILALLGSKIPSSLKLFLMTLAIVDDLFGILVIAFFYTSKLSLLTLLIAIAGFAGMAVLNRLRIVKIAPFMLCGIVVWICFLKSGVHATLAGVVNAMFIPIIVKNNKGQDHEPLNDLIHNLHPYVYFGVLPLFAFVNAGVILESINMETMTSSIPLGIFLGLFIGKQFGIFSICWLVIKAGWASLPEGANWRQFYGVCALCGVGFTMSLFIASLAFGDGITGSAGETRADRLAILLGSLCSAVLGYLILRFAKASDPEDC